MSYILDALRRADAERERGAVPGLHAQQFTLSPDDEEGSRSGPRTLLYVSIGLGVALVAALAWKLGSDAAAPAVPAPVAAAPVPFSAPSPSLAASFAGPAASSTFIAAAPMRTPAPTPALVPTPATSLRTASAPASATPRPARPSATAGIAARPTAGVGTTSTAPTAPPGNRIYAQAELPEEIRRGLPKLSVAGASYSSDAASRMVIINGRVMHEGDKLGNGLVLQQIKLKAAVLSTQGYRFEITY